ncbi:alpha 1,2 N-acetylglucosamine transferase, partial [Neisseria meningitidis]
EIVEHHQSGILLDRLTPESLADEIERLVLNPEAKNALATAAHQCVTARFTINHTADKLLDAI